MNCSEIWNFCGVVFVAFIILTLKFVNQIYFNMQDQILLTVTNVVDTVAQNHNALNYIKKFTQLTAENTSFEFWWDGFNIVIAVVALLFSVFTFLSQKNTSDNTTKLSQDTQRNLLLDLVRHLYRNLVVTFTLKRKLEDIEFKGYPSEEHLMKLKIPMENIHLESFYGNGKKYEVMHNLYLNLRNYNVEIDAVCKHLKDANINKEIKIRDIKTLIFKCSFLTERIMITIYGLWEQKRMSMNMANYNERVGDAMSRSKTVGAIKEKIIQVQGCGVAEGTDGKREFSTFKDKNNCYASFLFTTDADWEQFLSRLENDIAIELGQNKQGETKIQIIPLQ